MMPDFYREDIGIEIGNTRFLKVLTGENPGPVMIFFGGIHGNEPAGIIALERVLSELDPENFNGSIYAISGNLNALSKNKRFLDYDLNRMWTSARMSKRSFERKVYAEDLEQLELDAILHKIIDKHKTALYFIDLHTTSSKSLPFITINDSIINRRFSKLFKVPVILGIEEFLEGPLLSYINELGYVSLGFESGQHTSKEAITNAESFIKLALNFSGIVDHIDIEKEYKFLKKATRSNEKIYEIIFRYNIKREEHFKMKPGFSSFEKVEKGTLLATSDERDIYLSKTATLFMPLYQKKGEDGYYLIRKIKPFFLNLSALFRNMNADSFLTLLPGVKWQNSAKSALIIDLKIARFMAKPIFHLLGYRSRELGPDFIKVSSRDRRSKTHLYKDLAWYKKTLSVKKGF
ncbi:succinylglutamate desuccinylase/aspartoacylase family protein [Gramella lutea]|uniref:Succinylglutamate desuccinylase/aspartoacylase family protein n=1 Tax=Christiangramia lutea TaxID=1607951 RepID=A0A9X1V1S4_9FLAO|nr:succinylglutamate desuccinylase/aspartoacylase family protein [Christiangramia lutea]MCH4822466.1 succinylglutamate desuccinylase/aspartoacylase family protein [Christiangramia lutea]